MKNYIPLLVFVLIHVLAIALMVQNFPKIERSPKSNYFTQNAPNFQWLVKGDYSEGRKGVAIYASEINYEGKPPEVTKGPDITVTEAKTGKIYVFKWPYTIIGVDLLLDDPEM